MNTTEINKLMDAVMERLAPGGVPELDTASLVALARLAIRVGTPPEEVFRLGDIIFWDAVIKTANALNAVLTDNESV